MNFYIIDGGWGNTKKLKQFFSFFGNVILIKSKFDIISGGCLVVPGVGNFDYVSRYLHSHFGLEFIAEWVNDEKLVGICSGMQALCAGSSESVATGLNLYPYRFIRLRKLNLGWLSLEGRDDCEAKSSYYFAHRFGAIYDENMHLKETVTCTTTASNDKLIALIQDHNILLTQFHVELSEAYGRNLVENFLCESSQTY